MAQIEFRGIDQLLDKLGDMAEVGAVLDAPMRRSMYRLQRRMADYPPPPAGSTYVRGGPGSERLGQRWTTDVQTTHDGIRGRVGNNTTYGPLVQNERFQARVHRGRWQTDEQVVEDEKREIIRDFEREIRRELDR